MIRKLLLLIACVYSLSNLFLFYFTHDEIKLTDERFLQTNSCPLCYGRDLCHELERHAIRFDESYMYTYIIQSVFNIKNVFYGIDIDNGQKLVIKKLAHDSELLEFDQAENDCKLGQKNHEPCITNVIKANRSMFSEQLDVYRFKQVTDYLGIESTRCISQRLVDMFYEYNKRDYLSIQNQNMYILSTLKINIEPLFLKVFRKSDGWPFPSYYGTCGRVIVESFEGKTLNNFVNRPFSLRAKIAKKLLEAVFRIQENSMGVGIYLTDINLENISYNEETDQIYFVDVENSIIVDKRQLKLDNPVFWNETYYLFSFDYECSDCLNYDVERMCQSYHVDVNFYSGKKKTNQSNIIAFEIWSANWYNYKVCRFILSEYAISGSSLNLLHSIPKDIDEMYQLNNLLSKCASQPMVFSDDRVDYSQTRFQFAKDLINILNQV